MKTFARLLILFHIIVCVAVTSSVAQWVNANGAPLATEISCMAVSGTTIYAAGVLKQPWSYRMYRSTDSGLTWSETGWIETAGDYVEALAVSSQYVFAATENDGVYRSSDGGNVWIPVNAGLTDSWIMDVAAAGQYLFAAGFLSGTVFRSTDNGATWTESFSPWSSSYVPKHAFAVAGENIFVKASHLYRSTDHGVTWAPTNLPGYIKSVATYGASLVAAGDSGIYRSTDGGNEWVQISAQPNNVMYDILYVTPGGKMLLASHITNPYSPGTLRRSDDDGKTWIDTGMRTPADFAATGSVTLAGTADGVLRSTDDGVSWKATPLSGFQEAVISCLTLSGPRLIAGAQGLGVFSSTDRGEHWHPLGSGLRNLSIQSLFVSGTDLFAGTATGACVLHSLDSSATWEPVALPDTEVTGFCSIGSDLYASTGGMGIFRSSDNGASWVAVNGGLPYTNARSLAALGGTLVAGGISWDGGVWRSTDGGATWKKPSTSYMYGRNVNILRASGSVIMAGTDYGFYRTADSGNVWVGSSIDNAPVTALADWGTDIFTGQGSRGVRHSPDYGTSWNDVSTGFPTSTWYSPYNFVTSLVVAGPDLYAGVSDGGVWSGGIWRRPLAELITGVKEQRQEVPEDFTLEQNYPNPFNPVTQIDYTVGQGEDLGTMGLGEGGRSVTVQLVVYDLLGRQVAVLVNEAQKPGSYRVQFDGAGLASGTYFYRLTAGSFTASRKLILLR